MSVNGRAATSITALSEHRPVETGTTPVLSLIVPTRNEAGGVSILLERLRPALDVPAEVIFVDDSDDSTAFEIRREALRNDGQQMAVDMVHRTGGKRAGGLGTAVAEGLRRATGAWVCVLDADLQHPPELVGELLARAQAEQVDLVVASRYADGGAEHGLSVSRKGVSRACAIAARTLFPRRLRQVSDPLSGFFLVRREAVNPDALRPHGFKILLEILGRNPNLRVAEVGYEFSERYVGVSKASVREGFRYAWQLASLRTGSSRMNVPRPCYYDIHGIVTVASDHPLPELRTFRVRGPLNNPTLTLKVKHFDAREPGELVDLASAHGPRMRYDEMSGNHGFVIEIEAGEHVVVAVSPLIATSPHVLYTNVVEPILRWKFVEKGYALVHAAAFSVDDRAYLVTARTDTGKTTTMLRVLQQSDASFISDDLTLVDPDGGVLTYPKPLTISNHTVAALQNTDLNRLEQFFLPLQSRLHSKTGRQFALKMAERHVPVATINTLVQRLIPPPKYRVDKLVPTADSATRAQLSNMFVIQRGSDFEHDLPAAEALELLFENCEDAYGFPPYSSLEAVMLASSALDLRQEERRIVRSAFESCPARLISSSSMGWASRILEHLTIDLTEPPQAATRESVAGT